MNGAITNEEDRVFKLIEDWPERFGTLEWRKRAHRELDGPVHEAFIRYAHSKKERIDEECDTLVSSEWDLFNAAQTKLNGRKRALELIVGFFDGIAGVAALFFPLWLLVWFNFPVDGLGDVLAAHVIIISVWAILRLVQLRSTFREKHKLRFTN
jgi:hypothetical protein